MSRSIRLYTPAQFEEVRTMVDLLAERRVPSDADQAPAQKQQRATDPRALTAEGRVGVHWGAFISQWWLDISFEQAE